MCKNKEEQKDLDALIENVINNPNSNYMPKYEIWYECGCKTSFEESILKERQTVFYGQVRILNGVFCPNHPEVSKKLKVVFYCSVCGKAVTQTATGRVLTTCCKSRLFCERCGKRANILRNRKYREELSIQREKGIVEGTVSSRKHLKIDYMQSPRKADCKYYNECITKAAIKNTDLNCKKCKKYQFEALDINDFVKYTGGMDKTKVNKYIDAVYIAKLNNTIEKMLKKKAGKAKFNRLFQSRHKTHEQFILEAQKRSEQLRKQESRGKVKAK